MKFATISLLLVALIMVNEVQSRGDSRISRNKSKARNSSKKAASPEPVDESMDTEQKIGFSCLQGNYKYVDKKPISNNALLKRKGKGPDTCRTNQSSSCLRVDLEYNSENIENTSKFLCATCQQVDELLKSQDKSALRALGIHEFSYTCTDCGSALHNMCNTEFEPRDSAQRLAAISF